MYSFQQNEGRLWADGGILWDIQQNFQEDMLTISDEALLWLVLVNYAALWSAEVQLENQMVSQLYGL